ncbi:hypothetical protein L6R29_08975 [Myxococcota bacterium]|nr:hypothetical protein [Myxococcota bacterium]
MHDIHSSPLHTNRSPRMLLLLLAFSSAFSLTGCQIIQTQTSPNHLPWLSWLFWALLACSALTFVRGLQQEHDSLSLSGLLLLGFTMLWFAWRILPFSLSKQHLLLILLQAAVLLGLFALILLFLLRVLEDGSRSAASLAFLLLFFLTLPYTRATTPPPPSLRLPQSLQPLCFAQNPVPSVLSYNADTCVRLARLQLRLQHHLHHTLYPLRKDYTQQLRDSLPPFKEKFTQLPPAQQTPQGIENSLLIYEWKRLRQIAILQHQLESTQQRAEQALAQSRFYLWELAQMIRLNQESLDAQKQHYLEAERRLDQLLREQPVRWQDPTLTRTIQQQLLQQLKKE